MMTIEDVYQVRGRGPVYTLKWDELTPKTDAEHHGAKVRRVSDGAVFVVAGSERYACPRPFEAGLSGGILVLSGGLRVGDVIEWARP